MIRPDFKIIKHSAKGSSWDDHKYVKKIDGNYYYPSGYENGRTVDDIDRLAKEVIRGDHGNGQDRKNSLGEKYDEVQSKVNEILIGSVGLKKVSDASDESINIAEEAAKRAVALVKKYRN